MLSCVKCRKIIPEGSPDVACYSCIKTKINFQTPTQTQVPTVWIHDEPTPMQVSLTNGFVKENKKEKE